jgi:hypothetical protein
MKDLRTNWDKQLNTYGWVDEQNGIVRIPIEDAKRLLIQRGLPTRQQKKPAESTEVSPKSDERKATGQH